MAFENVIDSCDLLTKTNSLRRIQFGTANEATRPSHSSRDQSPWFAPCKQNDSLECQKKSKHRRLIRFHWRHDFDQVSSTQLYTRHIDPVELYCVENVEKRKFQRSWFIFENEKSFKIPKLYNQKTNGQLLHFTSLSKNDLRFCCQECVCFSDDWWFQFFVYISYFSFQRAFKSMSLISFDQFDSNN